MEDNPQELNRIVEIPFADRDIDIQLCALRDNERDRIIVKANQRIDWMYRRGCDKLDAAARQRAQEQQHFNNFAAEAAATRDSLRDDIDRLNEDKRVVGNSLLATSHELTKVKKQHADTVAELTLLEGRFNHIVAGIQPTVEENMDLQQQVVQQSEALLENEKEIAFLKAEFNRMMEEKNMEIMILKNELAEKEVTFEDIDPIVYLFVEAV